MPTITNETEYTSFEEARRVAQARPIPHHVEALHRITGYTYVVRPGSERE
jgi:hypothetical protein